MGFLNSEIGFLGNIKVNVQLLIEYAQLPANPL